MLEMKISSNEKTQVYKRRWIILLIYVSYSAANSFQWMEYSIISSIVMRFYKVGPTDVDWTSIIYMALYPLLVVPVSYFIEKKGLRMAALFGGIGTFLAAAVKVFSVHENRFALVIIGQGIGSAAQVFVLCLPSKVAAVWFKPSEVFNMYETFYYLGMGFAIKILLEYFQVSTACALAVFGTQLGFALGFVVPSSIVTNHDDLDLVGAGLRKLCWVIFIYMVPVVLAIFFQFEDLPPLPPSVSQIEERRRIPLPFLKYLKFFVKLFANKGFALHTVAYGLNIGVFAAVGTLLNQFILEYFPSSEEDSGRIGLLMVVGGMVASLGFGIILDKTHTYKETTVFIYFAAVIATVATMFSLQTRSKLLVYVSFLILGCFTNAYMPVGFEFAVEITYPADETTTTGILNAMTQLMGVGITLILGMFNMRFGAFWSLGSQAVVLLVGAIITSFVPNERRRQDASNVQRDGDEKELKLLNQNEFQAV